MESNVELVQKQAKFNQEKSISFCESKNPASSEFFFGAAGTQL